MTRIDDFFSRQANGAGPRKALLAYLCMGFPDLPESIDLALACVEAGADMLEVGVPFSDPTADGPTIARASQASIARGGGLDATLKAAAAIRKATDVPLILFGYYNPLFVRGEAKAVALARDAGIDGILVVDLPVEESAPLRTELHARGLSFIPLLAPTSSEARVNALKEATQKWPGGFVYYVSVAGVTGHSEAPLDLASAEAARVGGRIGLPAIVGFGVDSGEKARAAASRASGIAVGTALMRAVEQGTTKAERMKGVRDVVAEIRAGLSAS